jgi:hypothetical protein
MYPLLELYSYTNPGQRVTQFWITQSRSCLSSWLFCSCREATNEVGWFPDGVCAHRHVPWAGVTIDVHVGSQVQGDLSKALSTARRLISLLSGPNSIKPFSDPDWDIVRWNRETVSQHKSKRKERKRIYSDNFSRTVFERKGKSSAKQLPNV